MFINMCVCASFPVGVEGGIRDSIIIAPDHCLSFYSSSYKNANKKSQNLPFYKMAEKHGI